MKIKSFYSILICISLGFANMAFSQNNNQKQPYDYVNPFIGTGGEGHTYPGATVPFGMVQLSPDTEMKHYRKSFPWCAGYQYGDSTIMGFSHTHFSGTGHSDMGDFLLMPTAGELKLTSGTTENPDEGYRSRFSHNKESAEPGFYSVHLSDYDIDVELTASRRVGFHKYTFNSNDAAHVIIDLTKSIYNYDDKVIWSEVRVENNTLVTGYRQTKGWAANRTLFFAMEFSKPISNYGLNNIRDFEYKGFKYRGDQRENYPENQGRHLTAWFDFDMEVGEDLLVKVAISPVDIQGAINNLNTEVPHWDFEAVRSKAKSEWEKELNKIQIEAPLEEKEIFYTSLYHLMLAPVTYQDVDGRYRGIDNGIHTAEGFENHTIYSLWDTYRATHPLFTITNPDRVGDMVQSMIEHRKQSVHGILPVWSFHGNETWCMIGYHAVSVIADAYLKGIKGFDEKDAFEAMLASASYGPYAGLEHYMKYDYVPIDLENEGGSKTLEYAYDDWTIAQMAEKMGDQEVSEKYMQRATNYKNIFDKETLLMRAKNSDGTFREPFDPLYAQYGGDYTEGNAWQYSWYVPQDPQGLINLMGSEEVFINRLDSLFVIETDDEKYKHVEDIAGLIGQYAHGNEPSQHIAYLYNYAGAPWKTQQRIHQIMNNLFDNTPYGICGNEDCGQMSAWYIFSSMGFYPVCPGSLEYVIGSPCIDKATINLANGKQFNMEAKRLSEKNIYIQKATLNGEPINRSYLTHQELMDGGKLVFTMGKKPNKKWVSDKSSRPYSISK